VPPPAPLELPYRATLHAISARPELPIALRQALSASCAAGAGALTLADALDGPEPRLTATLIALDARLRVDGDAVPLDDRLTLDGRIVPRPGEAPSGVVVPGRPDVSCYREDPDLGLGLAVTGSLTGAAGQARVTEVRAVWWGVAPAPLVAHQLAGVLQGRRPVPALIDIAAQTARGEAQPAGAGMALDAVRLDAVERLCRDALAALFAIERPEGG
jgi:CO/xanthine dehydrogenase FAD-binding subunit